MPTFEDVLKSHNCCICEKRLVKGSKRINFESRNYCLSCGYKQAKKERDNLNKFIEKHSKDIIVDRLSWVKK